MEVRYAMPSYASPPNDPWKKFNPHRNELPKAGKGTYALATLLVVGLVGGLVLLLRQPEFVNFLIVVGLAILALVRFRYGGPFLVFGRRRRSSLWWRSWR